MTVISRAIERAVKPLDSDGRINVPLATEGEADDGHIFSIRGMKVEPRTPMLFGHWSSDQIPLLGSWTNPTKRRVDGVPTLRVDGQINLNGDGVLSEIRRGL